jgi:cation diffusion facilitator CzcD-associated flavoprotein CzcO
LYDPEADVCSAHASKRPTANQPPKLPACTKHIGDDLGARTGIYDTLDSNVGAKVMTFTHKPFPEINSAESIRRYGPDNPTHPYKIVEGYFEDGFKDCRHLLSLNTTVEKVEKSGQEWILTLRISDETHRGEKQDYWWSEKLDAVVVATGHYTIPNVSAIWGIDEAVLPRKFEHSKSFRSNDYVGKVCSTLVEMLPKDS